MNRKDFQDISRIRLKEARALLKLHHYDGSYYLAGYAIECALKACIARQTMRYDFPDKDKTRDSYEHNPRKLLKAAGLDLLLQSATSIDSVLEMNWTVVERWSEQSRYRRCSKDEAEGMIEAPGNRKHGVLPWVQRHW